MPSFHEPGTLFKVKTSSKIMQNHVRELLQAQGFLELGGVCVQIVSLEAACLQNHFKYINGIEYKVQKHTDVYKINVFK